VGFLPVFRESEGRMTVLSEISEKIAGLTNIIY
jgi:hypothetical protein